METPVIDAHWTSFHLPSNELDEFEVSSSIPNTGPIQSGISVFESQRCTFVEDTGASYISRLPFNVDAAWPLKCGVLLERRILCSERYSACRQNPLLSAASSNLLNSSFPANRASVESPSLFTIFLMSHPLDEMSPVLLKIPGANGSLARMCFANDENQKIVGTVDNLDLVVIVNKKSGLHSIWRLEKAQVEDYAHLYLIDDDGRITVAPEALAVPLQSDVAVPSTPVDLKPSVTPCTFRQTTPLRHRFQHLSIGSSPFLSPFRASLQKLKEMAKAPLSQPQPSILTDTASDDSSESIADLGGSSSQPIDLNEHIRRLSAVSFFPSKRITDDTHHLIAQNSFQNSTFGSESLQSFRKIRGSSKSNGLFNKSRSRHNSVTLGYSSIPGVFATSSHPNPEFSNGDELEGGALGVDEPLLPKVCLTLIWTEKLEGKAALRLDEKSSPPVHPRVASLSCQSVTRSPPLQGQIQGKQNVKIGRNNQMTLKMGPQRQQVFLVIDLIDRHYVCLLSGNQKLTCLSLHDVEPLKENERLSDSCVSYLPAIDAVYVPGSRLTACLEPNGSIILYSGITKICILGVVPALVSILPPLAGLHSGNLRPLSVRPSKSDVEVSLAKAKIAQLLSRLTDGGCTPTTSESQLQANLEITTSHLFSVPVTSLETKSDATWRLCLPIGHQFTLAFMTRVQESDEEDSENRLQVCERELEIHLPVLANITLVRHCLNAFRFGLPGELALYLLTRWFCFRNPPNADIGTCELASFARFLLVTFGLISEGDSAPTSPVETDTVNMKRLREKTDISPDSYEGDDIIGELLKRLESPSAEFVAAIKGRDLLRWRIVRHLPDVLFCLHMVFENDQLSVLLAEQVRVLAAVNHILARYARFSSYVECYSMCGLSSLTPDDIFSIPQLPVEISEFLLWSPHARMAYRTVPSLNRWYLSTLSGENPPVPYLYLTGVNDVPAALATLVLCTQQNGVRGQGIDSLRHIITFWMDKIGLVGYDKSQVERSDTSDLVNEASKNQILLAFVTAFVKAETGRSNAVSKGGISYQRAVLFLSELEIQLSKKLAQMQPAYASIIKTTLVKCLARPPSNCSPEVYRLIGRNDMARQFEIMQSLSLPTSRGCKNLSHILCSSPLGSCRTDWTENSCSQGLNPAERWASLVRPLLSTPSTDNAPSGSYVGMMVSRHFLLTTLENSPSCQVAFEDLRLQEAYKMLQTSSHIWLPRSCTDESTFGPQLFPQSNGSGSEASLNITKARLDMHLAAACLRTSAQPLGKGMLGLWSLVASPPPLLAVYPLCLRGRVVASSSSSLSALPMHQDLARGSLVESRRPAVDTVTGFAASDNPGNATALAIVAAVVATGCAGSLRTACSLSRLMSPIDTGTLATTGAEGGGSAVARQLVATASSAALSAASAVSSSNLPYAPAVLAAQHWPEFHNGVAAGLMISPHASIDTTWIVQNCKAIALGTATPAEVLNSTPPSACPYSPTEAGFLFGLGLNGHLNELSPHHIREFTIQVHDLNNAAVILGLCAGKRGSMDQGVLRLLAVHYRPLLLPEPVLVDMSVPSLCQAAAAFGLGLLFQGSAHRHIASILLTELGRPLGCSQPGAGGNAAVSNDPATAGGEVTNNNDPSASDANGLNDHKVAAAGGAGGFAGDNRELISLSAGFALGLVLLQRGDSPCGLSDLAVANTLHAYMTGGRRDSTFYHLDACFEGNDQIVDALCIEIPRPLAGHPLEKYLQPHLLAVSGRSSMLMKKPHCGTSIFTTPNCVSSIPTEELADLGLPNHLGATHSANALSISESNRMLASVDPLESVIRGTLRRTVEGRTVENSLPSPSSTLHGSISTRCQRVAPIGATAHLSQNQQIREHDSYNNDVSAPGAIMALGFAYLGTNNGTVSSWLQAPNNYRELELVRPDMLALRIISWGLVNYEGVKASIEWVQARLPPCILKVLMPMPLKESTRIATLERMNNPTSPLVMSTETDVENRGPRCRTTTSETGNLRGIPTRRQPLSPKLPIIQPYSPFTLPEASKSPIVDYSTVSQAYLNIIVGACFVIGLKYAGTCDSEAADLLHKMTVSILTGDWWPPNRATFSETTTISSSSSTLPNSFITNIPPRLYDLPPMEHSVRSAAATCLTALAMVLAGSGNLTVLRMVRKLRAIRFFGRCPKTVTVSSAASPSWPSAAETARLFQVAATVAQTTPNIQVGPNSNPSNQPVSTAAVLGSVLAPDFGLQMIYGSVVGLLFLGGGRLTLSNSPEAAALLTIAFFPRYPIYAGDNWYHLQCLRHLYVLATKPRRLCGVNVSTNQVEPVDLKYWYKDKPGCFISNRTAVFTSDFWERGSGIQLSNGKVSTDFERGTAEWKLMKKSLEAGFFFVTKAHFPGPHAHFEEVIKTCLPNWIQPMCMWQLRLIATFLASEYRAQPGGKKRPDKLFRSSGVLAQSLSMQLTDRFILHARDIQRGLYVYFFGDASEKRSLPSEVRRKTIGFRIWFSLPPSKQLRALLPIPNRDHSVSLPEFLLSIRPVKDVIDPRTVFWLYKFLYTTFC
ncbi:Anaphase-promoting complex subunit 1 [Taenia crassiceps]|uniref:Anaphase-promoting complex subunit 1 n=1 Tax=Taenia crassiceps TaxID=6207 RepID=A0ABR4QG85_9CEST